jgi:Leucine-rich repeat (LRR) protein
LIVRLIDCLLCRFSDFPVSLPNICANNKSFCMSLYTVDFNKVGGEIPTELAAMTNLEALVIHTLELEKSIPTVIGDLAKLSVLQIFDNERMTGSFPSELGKLTLLEYFKVHFPSLHGTIPTELGMLKSVELFDIGQRPTPTSGIIRGQISGPIPSEFGQMRNLSNFFSVGHPLNGTIPTKLGHLSNMETFTLAASGVEGPLPTELGLLTSMTFLNCKSKWICLLSGCF